MSDLNDRLISRAEVKKMLDFSPVRTGSLGQNDFEKMPVFDLKEAAVEEVEDVEVEESLSSTTEKYFGAFVKPICKEVFKDALVLLGEHNGNRLKTALEFTSRLKEIDILLGEDNGLALNRRNCGYKPEIDERRDCFGV